MFGNLGKFGFLIAFYAKRENAAQFLQNAIPIYVSPYIAGTICTNAGRIMAQFSYTCICYGAIKTLRNAKRAVGLLLY